MRAIAIDIGDLDPFATTNTQLGESLMRLQVSHAFQIYEGDRGNRIREPLDRFDPREGFQVR